MQKLKGCCLEGSLLFFFPGAQEPGGKGVAFFGSLLGVAVGVSLERGVGWKTGTGCRPVRLREHLSPKSPRADSKVMTWVIRWPSLRV